MGSIVALAAMATIWLLRRSKSQRTRHWPVAPAQVESTAGTLESSGAQPGSAEYYPELKYSYRVRGQAHGNVRRRFVLKARRARADCTPVSMCFCHFLG